jgi:hypothetical protein
VIISLITDANTRNRAVQILLRQHLVVLCIYEMLPPLIDATEHRPALELPADTVPAALPMFSGVPVSRKKILTLTHPSDCPLASKGTGSSY